MTVYAALLRGINVGGHHKVPMADLRATCEGFGLRNVSTYIQSGNIVCTSDLPEDELAGALSDSLEARFGFAIPLVLRNAEELARAATTHPLAHLDVEEKLLHVVFLASTPAQDAASGFDGARYAPDELVVQGRDVYVGYPNGSGRSKLTLDVIERAFGAPATARNWRTVQQLVEMTQAIS
ncbi:MAG: DUF1697 domain-containing protein [Chloroflexi bacterium]|nr:DUF1697 domain-containing protein [Chloroflexota bacterium]MDA1147365.1 DUF1697 domain-containing protein [Chloroflexota bacterium]